MRRAAVLLLAGALLNIEASPALAAGWRTRIDRLVHNRRVSVMLRDQGRVYYKHGATVARIPASNEKLLLSMALFDRVPTDEVLPTRILAGPRLGVSVWGDVWIVGRGDPTVSTAGPYATYFGRDATRIEKMASAIKSAGIRRIRGRVMGSTGYFARDWFAPGWKWNFPADEVALPTALTYQGNTVKGRHVRDPESHAARALTKALRGIGVRVDEGPGSGAAPRNMELIAEFESAPLATLATYMNRPSNNFFAEVLVKLLGARAHGTPGTIAKGARAIEEWASSHGESITSNDGSGLSFSNRVSAGTIARLLGVAEKEPWGAALRATLAAGGQGTLDDRLRDVAVRAKTGTLTNVSALSGWVYLERTRSWAEFSILSQGMYKATASDIEDAIVRTMARRAAPPPKEPAAQGVASDFLLTLARVFT